MKKSKFNALVAQSGGPTSVINATLCGVIKGSFKSFNKLYGALYGINGVFEKRLVELNCLFGNESGLERLSLTPGAALGSCRVRLPNDLDSGVYQSFFDILEEFGVKCFFYIGGNDSMDTVAKLSAYAKKNSLDVSIVGVPKTIDNDLVLTDHTPGYGSCAKFIACCASELWQDVSSYNMPSVTVMEVMGRDTGWLGCACALPYFRFGYGCSLVYLPEASFSLDTFLADVEHKMHQNNAVLVGVCEGINLSRANCETDPFGHASYGGVSKILEGEIKKNLKCKARGLELNLVQRCACHLASRTDVLESEKIGEYSVKLALEGKSGKMSAFLRKSGEYGVDLTHVDACLVANKTKHVPRNFINNNGNFVTEKCVDYLSPLILGETNAYFDFGTVSHFRLK